MKPVNRSVWPGADFTGMSFQLLVLVILVGSGCNHSESNPGKGDALKLFLVSEDEPVSGAFSIIAVNEDGSTSEVVCGGGLSVPDGFACEADGIQIETPDSQMLFTVRAEGYSIFTYEVELSQLTQREDGYQADIHLEALAPYVRNEDYFSGFVAASGVADFINLAYRADTSLGPAYAVKFYIRDIYDDPSVYFINTQTYRLHYDFFSAMVDSSLSRPEYDLETYFRLDRTAMAGTLVYYPQVEAESASMEQMATAPMTLTFFPSDTVTPQMAQLAHRILEARMEFLPVSGADRRLVYLPAGAVQEQALGEKVGVFEQIGAHWMQRAELYGNLSAQYLNNGEAYGTLRRLTPEQLQTEVVSFQDVLILTRLPNDLPIVGGTITEELQTPLAHVNVAAMSRGTPNMALLNAGEQPEIATLIGKLVHFVVQDGSYTLTEATLAEATAFWESLRREVLVPEADLTLREMVNFSAIGFADAVRVGAKAANVAELSHEIGAYAPHGFAVPFYYYDRFMKIGLSTAALCEAARADCVAEGRDAAVCERAFEICGAFDTADENLASFVERVLAAPEVQSDSALREAVLDGIRYQIRHISVDEVTVTELNSWVYTIFGTQKVRLRSSTNAEDLADFSGAGLYESVSAYSSGNTQLASEQIRKVWASVWNWRAYEERSFWNVDHFAVYMGVLVHQAFPDEAANGVLITRNIADPLVSGMYVNVQLGETPVTNPAGGVVPEAFTIVPSNSPGQVQASVVSYSSLSPNASILSADEVHLLYQTALQVQQHFGPLYGYTQWTAAAFDMEFKFHGPNRDLIIKQIRPFVQGE